MVKPTAVLASCLTVAWSVLTGCSVLTGGRAVPADTGGPRPVSASALHRALLDSAAVNGIMGGSEMTLRESRLRMFDGRPQFSELGCMVAWTPAEQTVYAHSGWTAVVAQTLSDKPGRSDHFVVQAVVAFPSRRHADDFFGRAAEQWIPCGDQTFVTNRGGGDPAASWTFAAVSTVDSTLWMTQHQDQSAGWSCQRALRVTNNVAIDVLACKFFADDEAITIAEGIDARLPSV